MFVDRGDLHLEQISQLLLSEPHGLALDAYVDMDARFGNYEHGLILGSDNVV
jgi:hypothetical protein